MQRWDVHRKKRNRVKSMRRWRKCRDGMEWKGDADEECEGKEKEQEERNR